MYVVYQGVSEVNPELFWISDMFHLRIFDLTRHLNKKIGTEEKSEEAKPGSTSEYKAKLRRQSKLKVHDVIDGTLLIVN